MLASHFLCSLSLFISFPARAQNNILTTEIGLSSALAANTNGMAWLSVWNYTSTSIWTAQSAVHRIRMRELVSTVASTRPISTVASTGTHTLSYHMNIHAHERVTLINNKTHTHTRAYGHYTLHTDGFVSFQCTYELNACLFDNSMWLDGKQHNEERSPCEIRKSLSLLLLLCSVSVAVSPFQNIAYSSASLRFRSLHCKTFVCMYFVICVFVWLGFPK